MKDKVSITLDETLMKLIDSLRGDVPRSKFIENYLKDSVGFFEGLWIFADELSKITRKEAAVLAAQQASGKPLHRHNGFIASKSDAIEFYDQELNKLFSVERTEMKNLKVGFDKNFKRLRQDKGIMAPMHFAFGKRKVYLFTKPIGNASFRGENPHLLPRI